MARRFRFVSAERFRRDTRLEIRLGPAPLGDNAILRLSGEIAS